MKNKKFHLHDYIFMAAGILLFLTMLSLWLICGMFARYAAKGTSDNSARVAAFGGLEVKEHKAVPKTVDAGKDIKDVYYGADFYDMVYCLTDEEVYSNSYGIIMPGVDIPKDPFVRVTTGEVACRIYIEVTEKDFPPEYEDSEGVPHERVSYEVDTDKWEPMSDKGPNGGKVYKYKDVIPAGTKDQLFILNGNKVSVSQYYDADTENAKNASFSLSFMAWMVQED